VFGTHLTPLRRALKRSVKLDRDMLARWLCALPEPTDRTSFQGVRRVAPGTVLTVRDGRLTERRYWSTLSAPSLHYRTSDEWLEAYRVALERAVERRIGTTEKLGVALSSGLDSTSVTCLAVRAGAGKRLHPLSAIAPQSELDESQGIIEVCNQCHLEPALLTPETTPDILSAVGRASGEPRYLELYFLMWAVVKEAERRGVERLLMGVFGDIVSGDAWNVLPSLLREGSFARFAADSRGAIDARRRRSSGRRPASLSLRWVAYAGSRRTARPARTTAMAPNTGECS